MIRVLALALAAASFPIIAAASDFHYCEITLDLRIDGRKIASPNAIVEFGKPAEFTEEDIAGHHGWQLKLVLDEPTIVRRVTGIPADIELYELVDGAPILRLSPHVVIAPGQSAQLQLPFGGGDTRGAELDLVALPRADADVQDRVGAASDDNG